MSIGFTIVLLISVLALAVTLAVSIYLLREVRELRQQVQPLQDRLTTVTKAAHEVLRLRKEFRELQSGTLGVTRQLHSLEQANTDLQSRLQEVAEQDPESRQYQRAAKLVASGASVEELMQECELPRAEAELLMSVHKHSNS